jgi:ABC-type transport system involved in multi-copper enzyme maturation permease subunit
MARFGTVLFQILAPLQLTLVAFLAALKAASAVAQEKDRGTLILLLMTRMSNTELVLGKLLASLLDVAVMLWVALPIFALVVLFGGVSLEAVMRVFAVTFATMLVAGSWGSTIALRNEKTFQTLAWTAMGIVLWAALSEAIALGLVAGQVPSAAIVGLAISPASAILAAARPALETTGSFAILGNGVAWYLLATLSVAIGLNLIAILRIRVWNPARESRAAPAADVSPRAGEPVEAAPASAEEHITAAAKSGRTVWHNPILWREVMTRAYGRKMILIRLAYLLIFALTLAGLYATIASGDAFAHRSARDASLPAAARPLAPFFLISLVIVNALAVTSITTERDSKAIDLLLVTDLSPKEFLFGKLGGVCWVTKEMILLPIVLCCVLWASGGVTLENLVYLIGSLFVMDLFAAMLGIHCGMHYANSRTAIGVSLGTVFFLFLGVATCIVMMISFAGSFESQLAPFLAFILGGSVGLYVSLGIRNQSGAIAATALLLPFATFYAITSFMLGHPLAVFLAIIFMYGFAILALLIPAASAFDFAMGRAKTTEED